MSTNPVTVESINPQDAKLASLRSLFPEAFREWKLDTNLLSATLGESISNERESYSMSWAGKSDARKQIVTPTTNTLSPDEASSVDFAGTDNIIIEWDNLEVLKLLQKSYTKQVKMIYIDPPYNTGKDFVYHDNFHASTAEYEEASGQRDSEWAKLVQNTETNGRYHSDWLSMMYPRLHLARNLLREDGVIFVSIGQEEVANLRKIMDEIYWEENFLWIIPREMKKWANRGTHFAPVIDFVVVFWKNIERLSNFFEPITKEYIDSFKFDDMDWKGTYKKVALYEPTLDFYTNCRYPIQCPDGEIVITPEGKSFRCNKESFYDLLWKNEIVFEPKDSLLVCNDGSPAKWNVYSKLYLTEMILKWRRPSDIILWKINASGTKSLSKMDIKFSFSKPVELISYLCRIIDNPNLKQESYIILDFFAWSGTTGHAVMTLNAEEKTEAIKNGVDPNTMGNRRYICVQLDETTDEKSEAYKAGYKKISEITAERLRRAGKKIKEENPSVSFDSGFRLYRLTPSCYQVASVQYDSEDSQTTLESLERAIQSGISPLREWVSEADVIVENLIKEWFLLNSRLENIQIGDNQFLHAEREWKRLYISFESDISMSTIQSLSREYSEAIFVVYDRALDDSRKVMMSDRVKLRTI